MNTSVELAPTTETPDAQSSLSTPTGAAAWPPSFALIAAVGGLTATVFVIGFAAAIFESLGGDTKGAPFTVFATALQGFVFLLTALALARSRGPLQSEDFGLQRAQLKRIVLRTLAVGGAYFGLLAVYAYFVALEPDSTPVKLGADNGDAGIAGLVLAAVLIAPVVEEIFFRGMIFRSLRNGLGVVLAAVISGSFFGLLHWDFATIERLLQVIPLIGFGIALALLYAWSASLWGSIMLHGTNNAFASAAVASEKGSSLGMALTFAAWTVVTGSCIALAIRRPADRGDSAGIATYPAKSDRKARQSNH